MNDSQRQDRDDRVMGAMDLVTKPIQALESLGQMLVFAVIILGLLLCIPIYLYVTGQPISLWQKEAFGLTLMFLFTLVYAPYYTIFGGLLCYAAIGIFPSTFNSLWDQLGGGMGLIFLFLLIGIVQRFLRHSFRWLSRPSHPPRRRLTPAEQLNISHRYGSFKDTPEYEYLVTPKSPEFLPPLR